MESRRRGWGRRERTKHIFSSRSVPFILVSEGKESFFSMESNSPMYDEDDLVLSLLISVLVAASYPRFFFSSSKLFCFTLRQTEQNGQNTQRRRILEWLLVIVQWRKRSIQETKRATLEPKNRNSNFRQAPSQLFPFLWRFSSSSFPAFLYFSSWSPHLPRRQTDL